MIDKNYLEWECTFVSERLCKFSARKDHQTIRCGSETVYLGSIFSMFVNVYNPALHVRDGLAVLLVGCLQDCAAARVKGRSALRLHLSRPVFKVLFRCSYPFLKRKNRQSYVKKGKHRQK